MPALALLIGILLTIQGVVGLVAPDVFASVVRLMQTPPILYLAAVLRIAIGVVFVRAAGASRLCGFLRVFGFAIVIGGLLTPFLGVRFARLILDWWASGSSAVVRGFAAGSLVFGLLVLYAVTPARRTRLGGEAVSDAKA